MILNRYNRLLPYIRRHIGTLLSFLTIRKAFNIALALLEKRLYRIQLRSRPFMYRIDPFSACNLSCMACETSKIKTDESRVMSLEDFQTIVNKVKDVALRISLYDMGEPFLNRNIFQIIKTCTDLNISTLISTNFNHFKDEDVAKVLESGLTVIEPCLDGYTQETYSKYRYGGQVEKVKHNIEALAQGKKDAKSKYPVLDVQVIRFKHVIHELGLIEAFLNRVGVDAITYRQESHGFDSPVTNQSLDKSKTNCYWLYLGMMARPDGAVYPCCGRGFNRFSYGNLKTQSLDEIWNNEYYQYSRSLFTNKINIPYEEKFKDIPCLTCELFQKCKQK